MALRALHTSSFHLYTSCFSVTRSVCAGDSWITKWLICHPMMYKLIDSPRTEFANACQASTLVKCFLVFWGANFPWKCTILLRNSTNLFVFLLVYCCFLAKTPHFFTFLQHGDRREPVQPCAELFLCDIIPGWGGVWTITRDFLIICTRMTRRCDFMVDFALAQRCTSCWKYTSLLHWC